MVGEAAIRGREFFLHASVIAVYRRGRGVHPTPFVQPGGIVDDHDLGRAVVRPCRIRPSPCGRGDTVIMNAILPTKNSEKRRLGGSCYMWNLFFSAGFSSSRESSRKASTAFGSAIS